MPFVTDPVIYPDDPPPLPSCCAIAPAKGAGALILGGTALVLQPAFPVLASGSLSLGGAGVVTQPSTYQGVGVGGIQLGGLGVGVNFPPALGVGGIQLGGVGVGTGPQPSPGPSGSGGEETFTCDACPDGAAFTYVVHLAGVSNVACLECGSMNGELLFSHGLGCNWIGPRLTQCHAATGFTLFQLEGTRATLGFPFATYVADTTRWNCLTPLTLALAFFSGDCNWPDTLVIEPAP